MKKSLLGILVMLSACSLAQAYDRGQERGSQRGYQQNRDDQREQEIVGAVIGGILGLVTADSARNHEGGYYEGRYGQGGYNQGYGQSTLFCFAQNSRGQIFRARGYNPQAVQNAALRNCYSSSYQCRASGCQY